MLKAKGKISVLKSVLQLLTTGVCVIAFGAFVAADPGVATKVSPIALSGWIVDWDFERGLQEADDNMERLSGISIFSSNFDACNRPFISDDVKLWTVEVLDNWKESNKGKKVYLSFVNDIYYPDGSTVQKSSELISYLLDTNVSINRHINQIVELLQTGDFDGVEIDYEKINLEDYDGFYRFVSKLYDKLTDQGKELRVVLEYNMLRNCIRLPEGPTYVLMSYNLYGNHTGPGPKTSPAFIEDIAGICRKMQEMPVLAISLGGFDWEENGNTLLLTEKEAAALAKEKEASPERDAATKYLVFTYENDGKRHTVWYADGETIGFLIGEAAAQGFQEFALWRFGGIDNLFFDKLL